MTQGTDLKFPNGAFVFFFSCPDLQWVLTMSLSSKPTKIKRKGTVRELKLVQTVNRRGADTLKLEEVKTPRHVSPKTPSTSHRNYSSSPTKRSKTETIDLGPIPFNLESESIDMSKKRQTLVFLFPL